MTVSIIACDNGRISSLSITTARVYFKLIKDAEIYYKADDRLTLRTQLLVVVSERPQQAGEKSAMIKHKFSPLF